jgi:hypothetical protein
MGLAVDECDGSLPSPLSPHPSPFPFSYFYTLALLFLHSTCCQKGKDERGGKRKSYEYQPPPFNIGQVSTGNIKDGAILPPFLSFLSLSLSFSLFSLSLSLLFSPFSLFFSLFSLFFSLS